MSGGEYLDQFIYARQQLTENHDDVMCRVNCMLCSCLRFNFVYNYYVTFLGDYL